MAGYYAANAEVAARLTACGPVVAAARVTGIPVMPDFDPTRRRYVLAGDAARREFAPGEEGAIVLLMGGGSGIGDLAAQAEALLDLDQAPAVIALAGRSAAALAGLQKLAAKYSGRLMPMGFTDRVSDLMRAADLIVTKPGGLSTSECLALGRPMILSAPIPGQEERNADYLLEEGAALKAIDVLALRLRAGALLGDPPRLARMGERARAIGRPYAARDVLDQALACRRGAARDRRPVQLLGASLVAVLALALLLANVEVQIEGSAGWAANLPTWRIEDGWLLDLFWGGRPMTGYQRLYLQFCRAVLPLPVRVLLALVLAGRGAGARVDRAVLGSRGFSVVPSKPRVWLDKVRTILRPVASPLAPGRPHRLLAGLIGLWAVWSFFGFGASRGPGRGIRFHLIVTAPGNRTLGSRQTLAE